MLFLSCCSTPEAYKLVRVMDELVDDRTTKVLRHSMTGLPAMLHAESSHMNNFQLVLVWGFERPVQMYIKWSNFFQGFQKYFYSCIMLKSAVSFGLLFSSPPSRFFLDIYRAHSVRATCSTRRKVLR